MRLRRIRPVPSRSIVFGGGAGRGSRLTCGSVRCRRAWRDPASGGRRSLLHRRRAPVRRRPTTPGTCCSRRSRWAAGCGRAISSRCYERCGGGPATWQRDGGSTECRRWRSSRRRRLRVAARTGPRWPSGASPAAARPRTTRRCGRRAGRGARRRRSWPTRASTSMQFALSDTGDAIADWADARRRPGPGRRSGRRAATWGSARARCSGSTHPVTTVRDEPRPATRSCALQGAPTLGARSVYVPLPPGRRRVGRRGVRGDSSNNYPGHAARR